MHGAHAVGGAYKCGPHGPFPLVVSFVAGLGREGVVAGGGWRAAGGSPGVVGSRGCVLAGGCCWRTDRRQVWVQ